MRKIDVLLLTLSLFLFNACDSDKIETDKNNSVDLTSNKELSYSDRQNSIEISFNKSNICLNPYKNSPLSALIKVDKEDIDYEVIIHSKNENENNLRYIENAKDGVIQVVGLYPDYLNTITLISNNKELNYSIKTDKLPNLLSNLKIESESLPIDGNINQLYIMTPAAVGYPFGVDRYGNIRWYLTDIALWSINQNNDGHIMLSTNRQIAKPYYTTGFSTYDLTGKTYEIYEFDGGYHHEVIQLPNGNYLACSNDLTVNDGSVEDILIELDKNTGSILRKIDLKNILPNSKGESLTSNSFDWFHNNSVSFDSKTNSITLSGRHVDAVINIDYTSLKLNWILGNNENWSEEYDKYFLKPIGNNFEYQYAQHSAKILSNGDLFLFDNGNNRSKCLENACKAEDNYSRGVIYHIDKDTMTVEQIWQFGKEYGSSNYSPYISNVDAYGKDNYLVHFGGIVLNKGIPQNFPAGLCTNDQLISKTYDIKNDKIDFKLIVNGTNIYRANKISLNDIKYNYEAKSVTMKDIKHSKIEETKNNYKFNDKVPLLDKDLGIILIKDYDRLSLSGKFSSGDTLSFIYNDKNENVVLEKKFRISENPYTALCVDVFDKEILTFYVYNEEINNQQIDLNNCYIKYNNKLYRLN